jgi:mycothiol synthase
MSIIIRPYVRGQDDDLRVDLYNRAHEGEENFVPATVQVVRRWDQSPEESHRHRFIATLDGVPAGVAYAYVDPQRTDGRGIMSGPHVPPQFRRRRVGTALGRRVLADLAERGMTQAELEWRDQPEITGFLRSLGFRVVRVFSIMCRALADLPAAGSPPAGTDVCVEEPTDDVLAAVVAVETEAFKEHFDYRPTTVPEYRFLIRTDAEDGTAWRFALARVDGVPVAYVWYGFDPREIARIRKNRGWLCGLGVLKPWRGRGIATYLMNEAMAHLRRDGMDEVELRVDDTNVTGARRLYERLGFTVDYRNLTHLKDL